MRPWTYYAVAAGLLLATVPIYQYIYRRAIQSETLTVVAHPMSRPPKARPSRVLMTPNESNAYDAIKLGRARCVAGIVYRTFDHVIEPWPGNLRCVCASDDSCGVQATGA